MRDKECFLGVGWELRRCLVLLRVSCVVWPRWTEAAIEDVQKECNGGDWDQYSKWVFKISHTAVDERCTERSLWIVLAPFCWTRYINHARYLQADNLRDLVKKRHSE